MGFYASKQTSLVLYCLLRQAERSVAFALSSDWSQFVAYYDMPKQNRISEMINLLKEAGARQDLVPDRQLMGEDHWLDIVKWIVRYLSNPLKSSWKFGTQEISFFSATLENLLKILKIPDWPPREDLIELRTCCFHSRYVIKQKLASVAEIRKADSIEHFNQSDHIQHVTLQEYENFYSRNV